MVSDLLHSNSTTSLYNPSRYSIWLQIKPKRSRSEVWNVNCGKRRGLLCYAPSAHFIWVVPGKIKFFNSQREKALQCNFIECWNGEQWNLMLHQIKHLLWFSSHSSFSPFYKAEFYVGNLIILVKICIFVWEFLAQRKATICCNLLSVNSSENAFLKQIVLIISWH